MFTRSQHYFMSWFAMRQQNVTWNNVYQDAWRHMASPGHSRSTSIVWLCIEYSRRTKCVNAKNCNTFHVTNGIFRINSLSSGNVHSNRTYDKPTFVQELVSLHPTTSHYLGQFDTDLCRTWHHLATMRQPGWYHVCWQHACYPHKNISRHAIVSTRHTYFCL